MDERVTRLHVYNTVGQTTDKKITSSRFSCSPREQSTTGRGNMGNINIHRNSFKTFFFIKIFEVELY